MAQCLLEKQQRNRGLLYLQGTIQQELQNCKFVLDLTMVKKLDDFLGPLLAIFEVNPIFWRSRGSKELG